MSTRISTSAVPGEGHEAPPAWADTARLVKKVTGLKPQYHFDEEFNEWLTVSSAGTGIWPGGYGSMQGPAEEDHDEFAIYLSVEEHDAAGEDQFLVFLHLYGPGGGIVHVALDDPLLLGGMLKKAARQADVLSA